MGYVALRIRPNFEDICMSYFASSRGEKIRTSDLYVPKEVAVADKKKNKNALQ